MPGKVNPTQCEALSMLACQVCSATMPPIAFAASQGCICSSTCSKPVIAYNLLQSIRLLADGCRNFQRRAVVAWRRTRAHVRATSSAALMLVTALNPHIGYDKAAQIAKKVRAENTTPVRTSSACARLHQRGGNSMLRVRPQDMLGR